MVKLKLKFKLPQPVKVGLLIIASFYLLILVILGIFALLIKPAAGRLVAGVKTSSAALQAKDLNQVESGLNQAQGELNVIENKFRLVSWIRFIPGPGGYAADLSHGLKAGESGLAAAQITVAALKPYADVLGFSGEDVSLNINSAEEKIMFILDTFDKISPQIDDISAKLNEVEAEASQIKASHYPAKYRQPISQIQASLKSSKDVLANVQPLLSFLPKLLGEPDRQQYLLVFQNNAELRPSGGFLTAYAVLEAHKGKITPLLS